MKKILFSLTFALIGLFTFAQTEVDYVEVGRDGLERLIIEKVTVPTGTAGVTDGSIAYRIFADMEAGYEFLGQGGAGTIPFSIESTEPFFNETVLGTGLGASANPALYGTFPALKWDSYVTAGIIGSAYVGVPTSVNADGYVAITAETTPSADVQLPVVFDILVNNSSSAVNSTDGWTVPGAVPGPDADNVVLMAQLTTPGELTMTLNPAILNLSSGNYRSIVGVYYSTEADPFPTIELVSPANSATVEKNEAVVLGAFAADNGAIESVTFYVNGVAVGTDNSAVASTYPDPTHSITWNAVGQTASIYAVAVDNLGQETQSDPISISVNDCCPTVVNVTSPADGNVVNMNTLTITVDAVDTDEPVSGVELLINGSSVGAMTNVSGSTYSLDWTPSSVGNVQVSARATNSANVETTASAITITVENGAPTVAITEPGTPFTLNIPNDTTFVATTADADGSVVRVDFYINGSLVSTDNDNSDGFSFDYTAISAGDYSVTARATDDAGAQTTSDAVEFSVGFSGDKKYAVDNIVDYCSSSDVFCMPVVTTGAVADILGYDVEMTFDASKVTPTGVVIVAEDLISDRDWTSYSYNVVGDTLIRISLYINGQAPTGTTFSGDGDVFCVEFARNYTFGNEDTTVFELPVVSESYASYVLDQEANSGMYITIKESDFNGSLSFWSDNNPIKYESGVNLITEIASVDNPAEVVTPDAEGKFNYNITNGASISISRDVPSTTDVMSTINGYDAYLTSKVAVEDASYRPNVYQIIAMDVNRDGRISAGDITQIGQRAVGQLDEFATDWLFVPSKTVLVDLSYRVSSNYPQGDGVGYSRLNVPSVQDAIELPIENVTTCPIISTENYKGILLGDVDGNYADQEESTTFKSTEKDELVIDLSTAVFADGFAHIPVKFSSRTSVKSVDFKIEFNDASMDYNKVLDLVGVEETVYSVSNVLGVSSHGDVFKNNKDIFELQFAANESIKASDINFLGAYLNGKSVDFTVVGSLQKPTSLQDVSLTNVEIYPNPANDILTVVLEGKADINIISINGAVVESRKDVEGSATFDISNLPSGTYTVMVNAQAYKVVVLD
jgi:hypothetical protein